MWKTLLAFSALLFLIYWYLKTKYFTLHGPLPGIAPEFIFGNMRQFGMLSKKKSIPDVQLELKRRFGDVYQFWIGPSKFIAVSNADDVQHIFQHRHIYEQGDVHLEKFSLLFGDALICNTGAKYKRHANVTLPLFRGAKVLKNFDIIVDCTDRFLLDPWRAKNPTDIHRDILPRCQRLFLAIFGYIGFDYDLEAPSGSALTQALHDFMAIFFKTLYMPTVLSKIYLRFSRKYHRAISTIEKSLHSIVDKERNDNQESINARKRTSLIASLVHSIQKDEYSEAMKAEEEKTGLSRHEIIHEMLFFMVAGYETTAAGLTWFIHLMSKNPRVQKKLKAELAEHSFSAEQIDSLAYLDAVIREVLRFAPPSNGTVRTLTMDDRLPSTGAQLYKGDQITVPFYNLTQDKRYWNVDPTSFYPERFLDSNLDQNHHPYALIPFGGGHRQCIGRDLARFELKVIAARLMQYITFGDGGNDVNSGGYEQQFTIVPKSIGVTISFD